jgi:hypothetical protein
MKATPSCPLRLAARHKVSLLRQPWPPHVCNLFPACHKLMCKKIGPKVGSSQVPPPALRGSGPRPRLPPRCAGRRHPAGSLSHAGFQLMQPAADAAIVTGTPTAWPLNKLSLQQAASGSSCLPPSDRTVSACSQHDSHPVNPSNAVSGAACTLILPGSSR